MYKIYFKTSFLILVIDIKIIKTDISFLICFFLLQDILKHNCLLSYAFNI